MAADPLLGLVSRALGSSVDAVESERVVSTALQETDRLRWRGPAGSGSLLFRRWRREASVEAALLPTLARRGAPVETVLASGIPPRHVREQRPWILAVEPSGQALCACPPADARRFAESLRALHLSLRDDLPTLRALGVPELPPATVVEEALAATALLGAGDAARLRALADATDVAAFAAPTTLVHGSLACERILVAGERYVALDWSRAHVGSPYADIGALVSSLDAERARAALAGYPVPAELLPHCERLHRLAIVRWLAWEAREGLRPMADCARAIAGAIA